MWYYCIVNDCGRVEIKKISRDLIITKEYGGFSVCGKLYEESYNMFFNVHFDDFDKDHIFALRTKNCLGDWVWVSNSRKALIENVKNFFMDKHFRYDRHRREQEKVVEEESNQLKHYEKNVRIFEKICNKLEKLSITD